VPAIALNVPLACPLRAPRRANRIDNPMRYAIINALGVTCGTLCGALGLALVPVGCHALRLEGDRGENPPRSSIKRLSDFCGKIFRG